MRAVDLLDQVWELSEALTSDLVDGDLAEPRRLAGAILAAVHVVSFQDSDLLREQVADYLTAILALTDELGADLLHNPLDFAARLVRLSVRNTSRRQIPTGPYTASVLKGIAHYAEAAVAELGKDRPSKYEVLLKFRLSLGILEAIFHPEGKVFSGVRAAEVAFDAAARKLYPIRGRS